MKKNLFSRSWYYFRNGWSTYFAFIFAAINTLTVTYYLAIDKYPDLKIIFPTFIQYVFIITAVGIPILIAIGYVHYKKTSAYRSEIDIFYESNPYARRVLINTDLILTLNLQLTEQLVKIMNNEKITDEEINQITTLKNEISELVKYRLTPNSKELELFKKIAKNQT